MKMDMKMKNECQGKLFTTLYDYVLVEISSDVDKYLPKVDNDGVIRPQDASFRVEAGDFEQERKIIFHGEVISAGDKCRYLKVGDEVMIDIRAALILPVLFGDNIVIRVSEQNVLSKIVDKNGE
jgi:hypothetical protein